MGLVQQHLAAGFCVRARRYMRISFSMQREAYVVSRPASGRKVSTALINPIEPTETRSSASAALD